MDQTQTQISRESHPNSIQTTVKNIRDQSRRQASAQVHGNAICGAAGELRGRGFQLQPIGESLLPGPREDRHSGAMVSSAEFLGIHGFGTFLRSSEL